MRILVSYPHKLELALFDYPKCRNQRKCEQERLKYHTTIFDNLFEAELWGFLHVEANDVMTIAGLS